MALTMARFRWLGVLLVLTCAHPGRSQELPKLQRDPEAVQHGLVVSVDPLASRVGADVLREGGNAVDAAVATAFALAVTHPEAGNIGGGGFMVVRLAGSGQCFTVDYRETAPALATPTMFLDEKGDIDPSVVSIGWKVVGVPGSPMGLWTAHQKAGKLPWRRLVDPAVELARSGFVVDKVLSQGLKAQEKVFARFEEPARVYLTDEGKAPKPGETLRLHDLAATLELIRDKGPDGFYRGDVADKVDAQMRSCGGLIRKEDLASYRAVVREPVRTMYRGYQVVSMAPPSSGGVTLSIMLNILEGFDLGSAKPNSAQSIHWLAESMKRAYYDRAKYLGDPDFVEAPVRRLLSKKHARQWRQGIGDRATPAEEFGADIMTATESDQTTHFSVIDAAGNMVSNTTTLEGSYGAKVIVPGTGFLLNNEMHDFNVKPGLTDAKGRIGTKPNLVAPGKRMLSSQTPTIVLKDDKPFLIVGSPGGRTIINTVLQVVTNVIDHGMGIQQAVDAGRVHHQWQPDQIVLESRIGNQVAELLRERGHRVGRRQKQGDAHCILVDPRTGMYRAGIDRRRRGAAFGF